MTAGTYECRPAGLKIIPPPSGGVTVMERGRPVLGVAVALLAFAGVPSALLGAGASPTTTTACGSLSRGAGAPGAAGALSSAAFVSAGESWAVGDRKASCRERV